MSFARPSYDATDSESSSGLLRGHSPSPESGAVCLPLMVLTGSRECYPKAPPWPVND